MTSASTEAFSVSPDGKEVTAGNLTGDFYVAWQSDRNPGCMLKENQLHPVKVTKTRR